MQGKLLIVSCDEPVMRLLQTACSDKDMAVLTETDREEGLRRVLSDRPNVIIVDLCLEGTTGIDFLKEAKKIDPGVSVIIVGEEHTTQNAIEAMRYGAFDYFEKPLGLQQLDKAVRKAIECNYLNRKVRYAHHPEHLTFRGNDEDIMIGSSQKMMEIWKLVGKIADLEVPVLITGESGTGKELLARAIYHNSTRNTKPFLAVNCAALPDNLIESELFGHEKGAFTDAHCRRIGKFEQCNGGTLFLDEIADMSLANQGKLLRILENKGFERVGGCETIHPDVRLIAATNGNLETLVKERKFRLDLYHRLRVVAFHLPSLRERLEDLPLLVELFFKLGAKKYGKTVKGISPKVEKHLMAHPWEGNIRELKNVIDSALVLCKGDMLLEEDFEAILRQESPASMETAHRTDDYYPFFVRVLESNLDDVFWKDRGFLYENVHRGMEKALIRLVMEKCSNNQVAAAKALGISRNTLRKRLECFGPDSERTGG